ncbi:GGDEF domain-containing protein [Fibrobacter sp.]|uniref:GGDEF domain-containing protein n=1 Tax=Fibrobacter sp. TaxID=35828 RepID=UPI00388D4EAD
MSIISYIVWVIIYVGGIVGIYMIPSATIPVIGKFVFVGTWGAVMGFIYYSIFDRKARIAEENYRETLNDLSNSSPKTEYIPVVPSVSSEELKMITPAPVHNPFEGILPPGAMPAKEALEKAVVQSKPVFPMDAWGEFCKFVLKNRPFSEVVGTLEKALPQLFPNAAGVLYMYGGEQSELHKILSFGDYVISDDTIMPAECASFNSGEIVVTDFTSGKMSSGCTHLHHHPQGISLCSPIEGIEEHFGILTIQTDKLPENEDLEFWKAKVSIVASTFGLYVANQNLNIRFQQHSIRDPLTSLFNRRYMEESLRREIAAANRHGSPIGILMIYPDNVTQIEQEIGRHAVDQLLWELGQRLPGFIRTEDIPCFYDGCKFCIILPGADYKITRDRAEKIRYEISQLQISYGSAVLATTLSIGVSILPVHAIDSETLIYTAKASMRVAMENGGDRVVMADALLQA